MLKLEIYRMHERDKLLAVLTREVSVALGSKASDTLISNIGEHFV